MWYYCGIIFIQFLCSMCVPNASLYSFLPASPIILCFYCVTFAQCNDYWNLVSVYSKANYFFLNKFLLVLFPFQLKFMYSTWCIKFNCTNILKWVMEIAFFPLEQALCCAKLAQHFQFYTSFSRSLLTAGLAFQVHVYQQVEWFF